MPPPNEAFAVQGAIRDKYDSLGGPAGMLGLPLADEGSSPDGRGKFSHFVGGSIYWSPTTGPMVVRGKVRDRWAASGWELGPLGYPVEDQHRMSLLGPLPLVEWCRFENGIIAGDARQALPSPMALQTPAETLGRVAEPAVLGYGQLAGLLGKRLNDQFVASPDNVAMRPGVDLTGVTDWQYGKYFATPRSVGFRFRGFHDNGLAPDTNFTIDIRLRFQMVWGSTFLEPTNKTLVAVLDRVDVGHDGGLALAQVYASVESAINKAFYDHDGKVHDEAHPELPSGALFVADVDTGADTRTGAINLLDVLITRDGDLQILVNPLTPPDQPIGTISWGYLRQNGAQSLINGLT